MSKISIETANEHLNIWLEAEKTVATGQSYSMSTSNGSRTLTRANLSEIRSSIEYWEKKIATIEAQSKGRGRSRIYSAIPRDL